MKFYALGTRSRVRGLLDWISFSTLGEKEWRRVGHFFFLFIFLFSFSVPFSFFCFFFFFFAFSRPDLEQQKCAELPSPAHNQIHVWDKNFRLLCNSLVWKKHCFHQDLRRILALRSLLEVGLRSSSSAVKMAYCLGTSDTGVFGWNGETAIIVLIRNWVIIIFFGFCSWQPRKLPLMIFWIFTYDSLEVKAHSVELFYFDKFVSAAIISGTVNVNIRTLYRIFCKRVPAEW